MTNLINNTVGLFKRHRKLVWLCLLTALASICITFWSLQDNEPRPPQSPKPIAAAISFQAYSNSPTGQKWAILMVTNREINDLHITASGPVELSSQPGYDHASHCRNPGIILPRSSASVAFEIPITSGTWRASVVLTRYTWRDRVRNTFPGWWPDSLIPVRETYAVDLLTTDWIQQ